MMRKTVTYERIWRLLFITACAMKAYVHSCKGGIRLSRFECFWGEINCLCPIAKQFRIRVFQMF